MKDKSKVILVIIILIVAALIAYVSYGITKGQKNPLVTMQVAYKDADGNEKAGTVKIELYPNVAPESVANFIALANNGFYDGLTFHRVEKELIQGGDKQGNGSGSAKLSDIDKSVTPNSDDDYVYSIKGEFAANDINNSLKFEKGVIAMARSDYSYYGLTRDGYNSASTQFFVVTEEDNSKISYLNQYYAPFGKVVEGYEYLEDITSIYVKEESEDNTSENESEGAEENAEEKDVPKMTNVRVDTFGANYGLPKVINYQEILNRVYLMQSQQSSQSTSLEEPDESEVDAIVEENE